MSATGPIVQLNNAATTPPLRSSLDAVARFLEHYGALHRGAGPLARATCDAVHGAIEDIRRFIGCEARHHLLFTPNTSGAISLLARMLRLRPENIVLTSEIEHTSNRLPWTYSTPARVVEVRASDTGVLDFDHLERLVAVHGRRVAVIAVSGASNLTGYVPPIAAVAEIAARCGALFFVDAAQLAPHRPIDMAAQRIDALALSAHKIYAPFGLGVLALPEPLTRGTPVDAGGGSIDMVSDAGVIWAPPRERHQPGTWNATGIVGLAASCVAIERLGWNAVRAHEAPLVRHGAVTLDAVAALTLHVPADRYAADDRIGTFPFTLDGFHHALLAAILEHEYGIEVRAGTICNHRLVRRWFDVDDARQARIEDALRCGDRLASYGIVRASVALHNTAEDFDRLAGALGAIAEDGPRLRYAPVPGEEAYEPVPAMRGGLP